MPDPGEPHRPEREDFASDNDYLRALEGYVQLMYPQSEITLIDESRMGIHQLELFLEDHSER